MMEAQWRIELLGGLRVSQGQRGIPPFRRPKVEALFAYLALYCRHPQPREVLIELLWPEIDPHAGRNNLRFLLHALRRELESPAVSEAGAAGANGAASSLIITRGDTLFLDPAAFVTDVGEFEAALQAAGRTGTRS